MSWITSCQISSTRCLDVLSEAEAECVYCGMDRLYGKTRLREPKIRRGGVLRHDIEGSDLSTTHWENKRKPLHYSTARAQKVR